MTPEAVLQAVDLTKQIASRVPSGNVVKHLERSTRHYIAYRQVTDFVIVLDVSIGPRGGVFGHVYLRDVSVVPAIDSIRVGEVPDFGSHDLLPMSKLFWTDDHKSIPDESVIIEFLSSLVRGFPDDPELFRRLLSDGRFDTPAHSIFTLQGGAPGLAS